LTENSTMALSGTYRFFSCDNREGELRVMFHNSLSKEDEALLMSPKNLSRLVLCENADGYTGEVSHSLKPEFNAKFDVKYGVEQDVPAPFKGKSMAHRDGLVLKETITYDNHVVSYTTTFSSFGATTKITSSRDGYIATSLWERVDAPLCGFYILESQENAVQMFEKDTGLSKETVEEMLSYLAFRLSEDNGVYTLTDFMGNGGEKCIVFKNGQEIDIVDKELNYNGTQIVTINAPNEIVICFKEKDSTKSAVWKGVVSDDQFVWTVEKGLNGVACSLTYRRYGDFGGKWRMLTSSNYDNMLRQMGVPEDMIKDALNERATSTMTHKAKGVWEFKSDSKVMKMEDMVFKFGEEWTYSCGGKVITEIAHLTKDGYTGCYKMGDKTATYKGKFGKQFMTLEQEIVGRPDTRSYMILARV